MQKMMLTLLILLSTASDNDLNLPACQCESNYNYGDIAIHCMEQLEDVAWCYPESFGCNGAQQTACVPPSEAPTASPSTSLPTSLPTMLPSNIPSAAPVYNLNDLPFCNCFEGYNFGEWDVHCQVAGDYCNPFSEDSCSIENACVPPTPAPTGSPLVMPPQGSENPTLTPSVSPIVSLPFCNCFDGYDFGEWDVHCQVSGDYCNPFSEDSCSIENACVPPTQSPTASPIVTPEGSESPSQTPTAAPFMNLHNYPVCTCQSGFTYMTEEHPIHCQSPYLMNGEPYCHWNAGMCYGNEISCIPPSLTLNPSSAPSLPPVDWSHMPSQAPVSSMPSFSPETSAPTSLYTTMPSHSPTTTEPSQIPSSSPVTQSPTVSMETTDSVEETTASVEQTTDSVEETTASVEQTTDSVEETTASVEQTTDSVEETTASVEQTTESVEETTVSVEQTTDAATESTQSVDVETTQTVVVDQTTQSVDADDTTSVTPVSGIIADRDNQSSAAVPYLATLIFMLVVIF